MALSFAFFTHIVESIYVRMYILIKTDYSIKILNRTQDILRTNEIGQITKISGGFGLRQVPS